ncbi:MAG TPA: DinB family protein [Pyrinomonadaceae bacterium]|nr:DinB family protein [Chloracidobacterium sp.]HRJ88085.1 DinB family protein [Pyrinomonadaceae bacterium]HRK51781.1 DinB family protein [Pyrinomonadaceae bacterium]
MSTSTVQSSNNIAAALIGELEHEAATTRTCFERIPAEKFAWKPHEKSMEFGKLASHVAEMFGWTPVTLQNSELDFAKMDYKPFEPQSSDDLLEFLDKNVAEAIETLRNTPDEVFMENWTMRNGDTVYFTMPKVAVMRSFVMNHIVHHRGQLSVYLRLNDIAVPSIYGPSADEGQM